MPAVALSDGGYCIQELQQFAKAIRGGFNSAQKVRLGLVLFFFHQSVMIEPLHRPAIYGVQWRRLDRFGLGERGQFLEFDQPLSSHEACSGGKPWRSRHLEHACLSIE